MNEDRTPTQEYVASINALIGEVADDMAMTAAVLRGNLPAGRSGDPAALVIGSWRRFAAGLRQIEPMQSTAGAHRHAAKAVGACVPALEATIAARRSSRQSNAARHVRAANLKLKAASKTLQALKRAVDRAEREAAQAGGENG